MTVHVLHAGDGYTYLTRQVAKGDHTLARGEDLAAYYTVEGNPQGEWIGAGLAGLGVTGNVSEAQMKALFGEGRHPDADRIESEAIAAGASVKDAMQASRLGRKFPSLAGRSPEWDEAIAAAHAEFREQHGRVPEVGAERDLVRWNVAAGMLQEQLQRDATDPEVTTFLAQMGKAPRQPVAGYDLVFTPVKSVSVLWALADRETSDQVREAHVAAWQGALRWLEREAGVTRVGAGGVAQINTLGLVAAAFEHRDSRSGDPNLHTHVAVSTKVQGVDGKWRSLDGRVLHALGVAASERYNSLIEQELRQRLGVSFVNESRGPKKRVVREIAGVDEKLRERFSSRRAAIEDAYADLVAEYVAKHGHTPPSSIQLQLAQQATLATREGKEAPRALADQRAEWRQTAAELIGERRLATLGERVRRRRDLTDEERELAALSINELGARVVATMELTRSTWRRSHVEAEALRLVREWAGVVPDVDLEGSAAEVVTAAMGGLVPVNAPTLNPVPVALQRADGESVYTVHGTERYTSTRILSIEDRLVAAASEPAGFIADEAVVDATIDALNAASAHPLNASQVELARRFASGGHRIEVGIGPAGTGKTTAMRAFARSVEAAGGRVLALAPTAAASTVLAEEIDVEAETAHKLIDVHRNGSDDQRASEQYRIDHNTVLLIDEAGMASTPLLDEIMQLAERHGASIRLLGDPAQLAAVESGGALRLLERSAGASYLDTVHRFIDPGEAAASLQLREGKTAALDYYFTGHRARGGLRATMLDEIYTAWQTDQSAGLHSIMVAGTNDEVSALNARARADRIAAGSVEAGGVELHDGNRAGVGDTIVTRQNERRLRANQGKDFVANGNLWTVLAVTKDGLKVQSQQHDGVLTLPADYISRWVELGYAATINRVQGMTVDTSHILVDAEATSREQLYVAATRGRQSNRMYAVVEDLHESDGHAPDHERTSIEDALSRVLARRAEEFSAHDEITAAAELADSLATLVPAYSDAIARVYDEGRLQRMHDVVHLVLDPDRAEKLTSDESWTHLATRLAQHEANGVSLIGLLSNAASERDLDADTTVRSLAKVFHHRIGEPANRHADPLMPAWIEPIPRSLDAAGADVHAWLQTQSSLIRARVDALLTRAEQTHPEWAGSLIPAPTDPLERETWRQQMAAIVTHRDVNGITDTSTLLGPARAEEPSWIAANAAAQQLAAPTPEPESEPAETTSAPTVTTTATLADRLSALAPTERRTAAATEVTELEQPAVDVGAEQQDDAAAPAPSSGERMGSLRERLERMRRTDTAAAAGREEEQRERPDEPRQGPRV